MNISLELINLLKPMLSQEKKKLEVLVQFNPIFQTSIKKSRILMNLFTTAAQSTNNVSINQMRKKNPELYVHSIPSESKDSQQLGPFLNKVEKVSSLDYIVWTLEHVEKFLRNKQLHLPFSALKLYIHGTLPMAGLWTMRQVYALSVKQYILCQQHCQ